MTREEEIYNALEELNIGQYNEDTQNVDDDTYSGNDLQNAFTRGVNWADNHPKSPWISVNDDLPCNHEDLLDGDNYTKKVLVVLEHENDPSKKYIEVCDMRNIIGSFTTCFDWRKDVYYNVTHWMRLPDLPKE